MRSVVIAASTASRTAPPRLAGALLRTQPDSRLAKLAGEGSEAAFEEIVRRHRSGLVSFASRIASSDSADDVVQDSMVKAHSALLRGDRPTSPRAWLFAIVRNTALNDRRDRRVHEHVDESHDGVEQPPEAVDRRRRLRELVAALGRLPRAQRLALVQRELEGKGHDEIAAELDVSPGAVRQLIFRARSALRAGVGVLLPMQLLRAAVLSGAADQASSGAAATGAGIAAKLGIGAVLTTGALLAGTQTVKDHVAPAGRQPIANKASASGHRGSEPIRAADTTQSGGVDSHRHRLIVAPKTASPVRASAPSPHAPSRTAQGGPTGGGTNTGSAPPPGGGTGGSGGFDGGYTDGGGGVQTYSAPNTKDCQTSMSGTGARDPAPTGVSPR
jgi:RNA polymerase sigma factor (sigma-70 family)